MLHVHRMLGKLEWTEERDKEKRKKKVDRKNDNYDVIWLKR